ncbi:hypothetical protein GCM10023194_72000 [Planotetraspora phitsanulokensis]|uniref:Uncharacterized protein n=1 Tax=Planotetraspora phitsanulokensis TaxID=575192 RepID=A0A8J3U319_9ACTN|nr:hypothetical protein [Planotetraspora phitsanulokensis]GII37301.1 hypothetical protein Pph01_23040 [Planotetraspora phitsanulokensis]
MNFCLSDLVPPLRWSDASRIGILSEQGDLPDAWWRSLPMERVLGVMDPEGLGELITDLALEHWPAAAVGDVLPALYVLDPDEADDPQVAIALDRAGSWPGLLTLSGRELTDQPFIKARPVLTALFTAVFTRLAPSLGEDAEQAPTRAHSADGPARHLKSVPEVPAPRQPQSEVDFPALIDAAFSDMDDRTWMVAQNRVFTDAPSAIEELAKLLAVSTDVIQALETTLRVWLAEWLGKPEALPYKAHLAWLADELGVAAPKSRLITAAEWHEHELRSLDVPAWHFVVATLPGYQVSGDWLVAGDLADLHERTRGLIVNAERPPTVARALELVSSLGIHPDVAKEWLENVPQLRIQSSSKSNGARHAMNGSAADKPVGQLKDVSLTRRCFRQPDGRWWLRVDITDEHLRGAEVPMPTGFAAYLGLTPGENRPARSAAGDVELTWISRPGFGSLQRILTEVAAKEGSHVFLTMSDEGMLRVRHLAAANGGDPTSQALRLVGYTAPGGTFDQAVRVIATRIGLSGPAGRPELITRLRERGDRDLISLLD